MKETLKQANCRYVRKMSDNLHLIYDIENDKYEVWFNNKNHASYGLIYKNTHLEFARNATKQEIYGI